MKKYKKSNTGNPTKLNKCKHYLSIFVCLCRYVRVFGFYELVPF